MRRVRFAAILMTAIATALAFPAVADAATINQPFAADSGDSCRYGSTAGTLGWQYGTTSPLPVAGVAVTGKLADRPTPSDPAATCRDDGYSSTAVFVAYAGSVEVARQSRTANNATVSFAFTLGGNASTIGISRVVIQVCRNPVITLPPSYCGKPVTYLAPPVA
ncbi:hypothetical protein ACQEVZ_60270 [Dactylosporangium sp. CA-152071]|uniref:hypothetical protein n=1 Tax=Dactylosporangium sp. CA-152071 TaxID=3239933 RepID=UPI003D94C388